MGTHEGSLDDTLAEIDSLPEYSLPFTMNESTILTERLLVIPSVLNPKSSSFLAKFLLEVGTDTLVVVTDNMIRGSEGLYFVQLVEIAELPIFLRTWASAMSQPQLVVGHLKEGLAIIAAPVKSFA